MRAFPWSEAMAFGFGVLRLSSKDFWGLTPRELAAAFGARSGRTAPLEVTLEAYRLIILDGGIEVRSIDLATPPATYAAAEQISDFGLLPATLDFTVAQLSPVYGPGHAATGSFAG